MSEIKWNFTEEFRLGYFFLRETSAVILNPVDFNLCDI